MKQFIKHIDENKWACVKCGLSFTLYGPGMSYFRPNYCPNCGTTYANRTEILFTMFEEDND